MTSWILAVATMSFIMAFTPGPNNFMILALGRTRGTPGATAKMLSFGAGVLAGFAVLLTLLWLGLAQFVFRYEYASLALRLIAVSILLWISWKIATSPAPSAGTVAEFPGFRAVALFQLANPKGWSACVAALGAFAGKLENPLTEIILLNLLFATMTTGALITWAFGGALLEKLLAGRAHRPVSVTLGLMLAATALFILFADVSGTA